VGGEGLWPLIKSARRHDETPPSWAPRSIAPSGGPLTVLDYEQVNAPNLRLKALKRQLEEAEEVVAITMNKYRKAVALLEECERHQQSSDSSTTVVHGSSGKGSRSMSVTREITRVVRV